MTAEHSEIVEQCAHGSLAGEITFPEVIAQLAAIGVERYHADYSRQEITYYWADCDSHVVALPHPPEPTGTEFSAAAVEAAVRQSQRGEHTYVDFIRKNDERRMRRLLRADHRPASDLLWPQWRMPCRKVSARAS